MRNNKQETKVQKTTENVKIKYSVGPRKSHICTGMHRVDVIVPL